jgi:hypothetical protein
MTIVSHDCQHGYTPICAPERRANSKRILSRQLGLFLVFVWVSSSVLAEEHSLEPRSLALAPILMVYGIAPLRTPPVTAANSNSATMTEMTLAVSTQFTSEEERQFGALFKNNQKETQSELFVLIRKKIPSRYSYDSWAKVKPGFGQFFPDDVVARSRISGVGIQDPEWLYIKMSLRF